jgi:hypothetical protein
MLFTVTKGPAQNQRHAPSMKQNMAAADAMVALASSDSGTILVSSCRLAALARLCVPSTWQL